MKAVSFFAKLALLLFPLQTCVQALGGRPGNYIVAERRAPLQDIVRSPTYTGADTDSLQGDLGRALPLCSWQACYILGSRSASLPVGLRRCMQSNAKPHQTTSPELMAGRVPEDQSNGIQWRIILLRVGPSRTEARTLQRERHLRLGALLRCSKEGRCIPCRCKSICRNCCS